MQALILKIFTTHRLTNLLYAEDGPFDMFAKLRDFSGVEFDDFSQCEGTNVFSKGLCCFLCTSVWAGIFVALVNKENPLNGLGYSAGAILLRKWMDTI